jgi:lipoprotein NlpD
MKPTSRLALLTLSLGILSACSTETRQAPVIDRPATSATPNRYRPVTPPASPAPVVADTRTDLRTTYTVRRGDSLIQIALDHGQNYRDLAAWNNLADPNDIKVGQVLRVASPDRPGALAATGSAIVTSPIAMPGIDKPGPGSNPSVAQAPAPKRNVPRADRKPAGDTGLADADDNPKATDVVKPPRPAVAAAASSAGDEERLSWIWPADGRIVATFDDGRNKGIDIAGKAGQQVMAAGGGKVMYAGSGIRGYGNLVIVKHSNNLLSAYAHNRAILVKEGQIVTRGQTIAEMGDSDADTVKLHFEIRQQGKPVDPSKFLPSR